jgi:hypothetical protein
MTDAYFARNQFCSIGRFRRMQMAHRFGQQEMTVIVNGPTRRKHKQPEKQPLPAKADPPS